MVALAVPLLWGDWIGPSDVLVFAIMYVLSGFGVTVGFIGCSRRAFAAHSATRYAFAILGSLLAGSTIPWGLGVGSLGERVWRDRRRAGVAGEDHVLMSETGVDVDRVQLRRRG